MLWRADPEVMAEPDPSAGDPHTVLGVDPDTPPEQIRVAAAKAKRAYNPDAYPDAEKRDAREAFYEIVAAERALLDGPPDRETDGRTPPTGIAQSGTRSDEPDTDRGAGSETTEAAEATSTTQATEATSTTRTAEATRTTRTAEATQTTGSTSDTAMESTSDTATESTPDTATEPLRADLPTLSFPDSESRRFSPGDVTCRVVDAAGEPLSAFRLYAERVGGDERVLPADGGRTVADDTDETGADVTLALSPGRWRICADHADGRGVAAPTGDPATTATTDRDSTPTPGQNPTPTPDPVAVTVVPEGTDDDTTVDRRRLDGRARRVVSSLAAAAAVVSVAGVVLSTYLDTLPTVPAAVVGGVVCVAGVVSYLRVLD